MGFQLNERLAAGCIEVVRMGGCRVLLKNEANFPWFIVVPEVDSGIEDLHQLGDAEFTNVMNVVREISRFVSGYFTPEKLNVGCIGNVVRQMHIHVVARNVDDVAWPGVVWAHEGKKLYGEGEWEEIVLAARKYLLD